MDSMALIALGICSRSSGFSPNGSIAGGNASGDAGICGGIAGAGGGVGLLSFIKIQRFSLGSVQVQQSHEGLENCLVKVAFESSCSNKFDWKPWSTNERTQNPGQLASEKQIACQPGEQNSPSHAGFSTEVLQQLGQAQIAYPPRKSDPRAG